MEALWNQVNLQRPPYRSWEVHTTKFDLKQFIKTIDDILEDFQSFQILHTEAALLSRLIYRMKSKFRNDKGLKYMEKVNRALLNYLNMSIKREYELLKEYIEIDNKIVSLPPRQTLEFVLVRTQGFSKLMCRVESSAIEAANVLKSRFYTGQYWSVAMIAYGVISRIWALSRHIIKRACVWYDNIFSYIKNFKTVCIPWLPDDYVLPPNLSVWLDLPWFNENMETLPLEDDWKKSIFNLIKANNTNEANLSDDKLISSQKTLEKENDISSQQHESSSMQLEDDLGKPISRDSFDKMSSQPDKKTKKTRRKKEKTVIEKQKSLKFNMKSEKDLVQLLRTKSHPNYDELQWKLLIKRLKKFLIKLTKNNTCDLNDKSLKKINLRMEKWTSSQ